MSNTLKNRVPATNTAQELAGVVSARVKAD